MMVAAMRGIRHDLETALDDVLCLDRDSVDGADTVVFRSRGRRGRWQSIRRDRAAFRPRGAGVHQVPERRTAFIA